MVLNGCVKIFQGHCTSVNMKKKRFPAVEIHKTITAIIVLLFISFSVHAETIYELDFTSASGNVKEWFEKINWEFREDIDDMNLRFEDGKLVVEPTKDELGVMMRVMETTGRKVEDISAYHATEALQKPLSLR